MPNGRIEPESAPRQRHLLAPFVLLLVFLAVLAFLVFCLITEPWTRVTEPISEHVVLGPRVRTLCRLTPPRFVLIRDVGPLLVRARHDRTQRTAALKACWDTIKADLTQQAPGLGLALGRIRLVHSPDGWDFESQRTDELMLEEGISVPPAYPWWDRATYDVKMYVADSFFDRLPEEPRSAAIRAADVFMYGIVQATLAFEGVVDPDSNAVANSASIAFHAAIPDHLTGKAGPVLSRAIAATYCVENDSEDGSFQDRLDYIRASWPAVAEWATRLYR